MLFDRKKQRIGILTKVTKNKTQAELQWEDGEIESVTANEFSLRFKRVKAIRLRDFPLNIPYEGTKVLPARIRKDEYSIDKKVTRFTRLLDIVAFQVIDQKYILENLLSFLPHEVADVNLPAKTRQSFLELFINPNKEQFIAEIVTDKLNHSIYRVRISTSLLTP